MTPPSSPTDRDRWLDRVTRGLPAQRAESIRAEMTAHLEDAIDDYVQQGIPQAEAHQRALADLGDPAPVARRFNDVHRGYRHYRGAMLACVLLLLVKLGFYPFYVALGVVDYSLASRLLYIGQHIVFSALVIYIVIVIRWLLLWRFDHPAADLPARLLIGGFVVYLIGNVFLELVVDSWDPIPSLSNTSDPVIWLGLLVMDGGMLLSSAATVWFGIRVLRVQQGMIKAVSVLSSLEGGLTFTALALLDLGIDQYMLVYAFGFLFELLLWPAIMLLFFQVVYMPRRLPPRTA